MRITLVLIFSFLMLGSGSGQDRPVRFEHITAKDGLSQGHVLCMIQDSRGYIWAGTYYGLNRFNGYNFDVFYADDNNPNSLFINVVFSLFEDHEGKIWCGTWGVDIYDPGTESFSHIYANEGPNSISAGEVSRILEDGNGNMWFATQGGGLNKYDPQTGNITVFRKDDSLRYGLQSDHINDIVLDSDGYLWIATEEGGLSRMNLADETIHTYRHNGKDNSSIPCDRISALYIDKEQRLWIGDNNGYLTEYIKDRDAFRNYNCCSGNSMVSRARIFEITEDWDGNLLLATNGAGVICFYPDKRATRVYLHDSRRNETLLSNENSSLLLDNTQTLFVGSFGRGISKYSPFNSKFNVFKIPVDKYPSSDINAFTDAIEDSQGNLVTGTYHGFFVWNQKSWEYKHYLPGTGYDENKVLTLELAPDGSIWVGTMSGLHRYDAAYNRINTYILDPSLKDQSVYAIEFDHRNNLWIALFLKGLLKVREEDWRGNPGKLKYSYYSLDYADTNSIQGNQQWIIKLDRDSNLWIGGVGGLSRYNYEQDNFTRVFTGGTVKTFDLDSKNDLWIGTIGTGIFHLDTKEGTLKKYTTSDGLSHGFIYGILADSQDNLWISSEGGLSRFSIPAESFSNYDIRDGLPSDHFDDKAESKLSGDRFYFGTNNGFIVFKPKEIRDDTTSVNVVLTGLLIDNQATEFYRESVTGTDVPIGQLEQMRLEPSERDIEFEFAALHFAAPYKIRYRYKLEGYDTQWINTDAVHRTAKYTNLNGGQYTFLVNATNSDGQWSQKPLEIKITVVPPLYKTWYFKIIIIFIAIMVMYLIFAWRLNQEIRQKRKLETTVSERTREIREKNVQLEEFTENLKEINALLKERQQQIEEQSEELQTQHDKLAHSNATKDKLLSVIAHDLKNPFNALMGYAELLLQNYNQWDDDKKIRFLTLLQETSGNAYRLLENLLQWSRSQSGMLQFNPARIDTEEIIHSAVTEVSSQAVKKSVKIDVKVNDENGIDVKGDANMLSVILRNLLSNAVKFSHPGEEINVEVIRVDTKYAQFAIRDKGKGISREAMNDLFVFEKNKSTEGTEGEKGTGLGLILCHEFVTYHSGKIWCESNTEEGTTFYFTIPLARDE